MSHVIFCQFSHKIQAGICVESMGEAVSLCRWRLLTEANKEEKKLVMRSRVEKRKKWNITNKCGKMAEFVVFSPVPIQCLHSMTPQLKSSSWMGCNRRKPGHLLLNSIECFVSHPHYSNKTHNNTLYDAGNSPLPSYRYLRLIAWSWFIFFGSNIIVLHKVQWAIECPSRIQYYMNMTK